MIKDCNHLEIKHKLSVSEGGFAQYRLIGICKLSNKKCNAYKGTLISRILCLILPLNYEEISCSKYGKKEKVKT